MWERISLERLQEFESMSGEIRFNESAVFQAQRLSIRGSVKGSLIRGLGSDAGLSNASEALLANVSSENTADAYLAQDAIAGNFQEGGIKLAARLGSQVVDQNLASTLVSGGGLSLRDQSNLITVGLKSLGGARGSGVNFLG